MMDTREIDPWAATIATIDRLIAAKVQQDAHVTAYHGVLTAFAEMDHLRDRRERAA